MSLMFGNPWVLTLLVVPAGLLLWVWRRAGSRVVLPFDHSDVGRGRGWWFVVNCAESIAPLLLAVAIVLLAEPQRLGVPETQRKLTNIELLVDVSGSMSWPFGDGTRYDVSMRAVDSFLSYRQGDAVGLTFFGNNVIHWTPLTTDASAIRCAPPFMNPKQTPLWMQGTMIGKALQACKKVLVERLEGERMIVMITDGSSFDLFGGNDLAIAKELKDANIVVYSIHISDENIPEQISNITGLTGGEVFAPDSPEGLQRVFEKIDRLHQAPLERKTAETKDNFYPYCVAGLGLLGLGLLTMFGWRWTPW